MGNCLSKNQIEGGEEINSTAPKPTTGVAQRVRSQATQETKSQAANERNPTYQVTLDGSIYFFDTLRQVSEATELLAPLKAVCGVIVKALETTRAMHANKDEWGNLMDKIQKMQDTIEGQINRLQKDGKLSYSPLTTDPAAVAPLRDFTKSLGEIFEASSDAMGQTSKGSNTLKRVLTVRIDAENILQYKEAVNSCFNDYMVAINLFTAHYTKEQGDIAAIRALKIAANPGGNQHQICTQDTRTELLHDIHTWADDTTSIKQIFWIADRAGTGKSTVAKQIVTEWEKAAKPVVPFFFSINATDTMTNAKFCSTLAVKLAELADFGSFRTTLAEILSQKLTIETLGFEEQFEQLVIAPLEKTNKPVLVVIDALDECDERGRSELLLAFLNKLDKIPKTKVLITSRPLVDIKDILQNQPIVYSRTLQGSDNLDSTTEDILRHLDQIFTRSRKLQHLKHHVPRLSELANGLFIWASTAGKFLERSLDLDATLSAIEHMHGLDDLYTRIMECAIPESDVESRNAVSVILQAILAAQRPLFVSEMQNLLSKPQVVQPVVEVLASVLSSGAEDKPGSFWDILH
ncbi:hypothetical protein M408DRAFT_31158 [Serendipita vermifera MAFF 305830]|uniref:NACHT domain-containing protein n=1 Tax=Serendipita vermifera MAFF 305830 TaxID=933852 RepID=A0A0C3AJK1_SERVB|nr:hypothetical protein M408DRAFT_31158 [Serendipita vermifera MAFF 305830]